MSCDEFRFDVGYLKNITFQNQQHYTTCPTSLCKFPKPPQQTSCCNDFVYKGGQENNDNSIVKYLFKI